MTKEERHDYFQDWYWNRGGKERLRTRRRELGPAKYGSARTVPSKVL